MQQVRPTNRAHKHAKRRAPVTPKGAISQHLLWCHVHGRVSDRRTNPRRERCAGRPAGRHVAPAGPAGPTSRRRKRGSREGAGILVRACERARVFVRVRLRVLVRAYVCAVCVCVCVCVCAAWRRVRLASTSRCTRARRPHTTRTTHARTHAPPHTHTLTKHTLKQAHARTHARTHTHAQSVDRQILELDGLACRTRSVPPPPGPCRMRRKPATHAPGVCEQSARRVKTQKNGRNHDVPSTKDKQTDHNWYSEGICMDMCIRGKEDKRSRREARS